MTRTPAERVADILEAIQRCRSYRASIDDASPAIAQMAVDAVIRNIEIIGEAANHLPAEITKAHPEIEWQAVVGMRNNLIHQYFATDHAVVLEVIDRDLLPLEAALAPHAPQRPHRVPPPFSPAAPQRPKQEPPGLRL